ncbi:MAG: hypothetical protein Q8O75_01740 [bacterium]|nr:hypothetical protein [bacterium]
MSNDTHSWKRGLLVLAAEAITIFTGWFVVMVYGMACFDECPKNIDTINMILILTLLVYSLVAIAIPIYTLRKTLFLKTQIPSLHGTNKLK